MYDRVQNEEFQNKVGQISPINTSMLCRIPRLPYHVFCGSYWLKNFEEYDKTEDLRLCFCAGFVWDEQPSRSSSEMRWCKQRIASGLLKAWLLWKQETDRLDCHRSKSHHGIVLYESHRPTRSQLAVHMQRNNTIIITGKFWRNSYFCNIYK